MAYPQYNIMFQSQNASGEVRTTGGVVGPVRTDGSHTFVLSVNGTLLNVELSHDSDQDRTPKLIVTFR